MARTKIQWTRFSWNPTTGCSKVSPGCAHCYAERMAPRLKAMGQKNYANGFAVATHPVSLELPLTWKKPQLVFVNSMGDLFHEQVPDAFIEQVFDVMRRAPQHRFQVLTKRSERLVQLSQQLPWPENVLMGVTIENAAYGFRIDHLRQTPAKVKFLSLEPLLGPIPNMNLTDIRWLIAGGESGPGARKMEADWVRDIRDQRIRAGNLFFFKQWGGVNKKKAGRILDGRTWDEMP